MRYRPCSLSGAHQRVSLCVAELHKPTAESCISQAPLCVSEEYAHTHPPTHTHTQDPRLERKEPDSFPSLWGCNPICCGPAWSSQPLRQRGVQIGSAGSATSNLERERKGEGNREGARRRKGDRGRGRVRERERGREKEKEREREGERGGERGEREREREEGGSQH